MQLPPELAQGIDELLRKIPPAELARASAELTSEYRGERKRRPQLNKLHHAAYLISRLPATYAVLTRVFREVKERVPGLQIGRILDLGSGPGTAMWAAAEQFPTLKKVVLMEDVPEWIAIGKQLAKRSQRDAVRLAEWQPSNVIDQPFAGMFDLVTISYLTNELRSADVNALARAAWNCAGVVLVIIEPGTPAGFERIRQVRRELIEQGGHILAPCPHEAECPMAAGDWCHFAQRLERSSEHRHAKSAMLGYEDEKYSYIAVGRVAVLLPMARILRHPRKHSGHIELELCTLDGLKQEIISKKHGPKYKQARKAEWGDVL